MNGQIGLSVYCTQEVSQQAFNGLFHFQASALYSNHAVTVHNVEDLKSPMLKSAGKYAVFIGTSEEISALKTAQDSYHTQLHAKGVLGVDNAVGKFFKDVYLTSEEKIMAVEKMVDEKLSGRNFIAFKDDGTVNFKNYSHRIEDVLAYLTVAKISHKIDSNLIAIYKPHIKK